MTSKNVSIELKGLYYGNTVVIKKDVSLDGNYRPDVFNTAKRFNIKDATLKMFTVKVNGKQVASVTLDSSMKQSHTIQYNDNTVERVDSDHGTLKDGTIDNRQHVLKCLNAILKHADVKKASSGESLKSKDERIAYLEGLLKKNDIPF